MDVGRAIDAAVIERSPASARSRAGDAEIRSPLVRTAGRPGRPSDTGRFHAISSERIRTRRPRDFRPGAAIMPRQDASGTVPEEVDVLIVGCGPAGLTLAAQLSAFPDIKTCIVEQKPGPLRLRPGRRHRLPHDGDVRGLWLQRACAEGSLLDQRDDILEARRQAARRTSSAADGCRTSKTGCRNFRMSF